MSHFAVIAPALPSHFAALEALAGELVERGHRVTFVHEGGARDLLSDASIGFASLPTGGDDRVTPRRTRSATGVSRVRGGDSILGIRRVIADMAEVTDRLCRELPGVLQALAVDGVIADQMEAAGGLVAEALQLPFVSVACALPVNREPDLPLAVMPFTYATDERARQRYAISERVYDYLMRDHARVVARHARAFGLAPRSGLHECLSPLAQISQTPSVLDFPRRQLPDGFHAPGPLRRSLHRPLYRPLPPPHRPPRDTGIDIDADTDIEPNAATRTWPADRRRPFVFASLGTLQGHRYRLFRTIARACRRLDAELLVAHCGGLTTRQASALEAQGATAVTDFADQQMALARAQAVVTHGGLNTVIDALAAATPMLVVPLAFDQPGVAARVAWHGYGRRVSRWASSRHLARELGRLLEDADCRDRLRAGQAALAAAGGVTRAADIVEGTLARHATAARQREGAR